MDAAGVRDRPAHPRLHAGAGAWTTFDGQRVKIGPVKPRHDATELGPGDLAVGKRSVLVGTGTHAVELGEVQPPGKPRMAAADWARGLRTASARFGDRVGTDGQDRRARAGTHRRRRRRARSPYDALRRSTTTTPTSTWRSPRLLDERGLTGRDAAFATELAAGTARMQGTYRRDPRRPRARLAPRAAAGGAGPRCGWARTSC